MEWLLGQTLGKIIDQGPLPVPQASAFLVQICSALDAAHRAGVVYRDIKPDNVYVVTLASGHNGGFPRARLQQGRQPVYEPARRR